MTLPSGEQVQAHERFFIITVSGDEIDTLGWRENEKSVIASYHWWSMNALNATTETVYPGDLVEMLTSMNSDSSGK